MSEQFTLPIESRAETAPTPEKLTFEEHLTLLDKESTDGEITHTMMLQCIQGENPKGAKDIELLTHTKAIGAAIRGRYDEIFNLDKKGLSNHRLSPLFMHNPNSRPKSVHPNSDFKTRASGEKPAED